MPKRKKVYPRKRNLKKWPARFFGFSLIELLVVATILIILTGLILLSYTNSAKASRDSQRDKDIDLVRTALEQYYEVYGVYPVGNSIDDLMSDPSFSQFVQVGSIKDPINTPPYVYSYSSNGVSYSLGSQKETAQNQSSSSGLADGTIPTPTTPVAPTNTPAPTSTTGPSPTRTPTLAATSTPSITPTVTTSQTVSSLSLLNANTESVVRTMSLNDTVDVSSVPQFNFVFATNPSPVGSTKIQIVGPDSETRYENYLPYAVGVIDEMEIDNYWPLDWSLGDYSMTMTPYSQANGAGAPGTPKTFHIAVVQSGGVAPSPTPLPAGTMSSLSIINADTGAVITTLSSGSYTIHKSQYPSFTVQANTSPQNVAYVKIEVSGPLTFNQYENVIPYTVSPYENGEYENWGPPNGTYTITATSYGPTQTGGVGTSKTITLIVAN